MKVEGTFHGGVAAAYHEHFLACIRVALDEAILHALRRVAGNAESAGNAKASGGEKDSSCRVAAARRVHLEAVVAALQRVHAFARAHVQLLGLHAKAAVIGEYLL